MSPQTPIEQPGIQTVVSTQTVVDLETPEQKYARLYSQPLQPQQSQAAPTIAAPQTPIPQVVALPPEVADTLLALRNEVAELKSSRTPSPATVSSQVATSGWVDKIREGDFVGAEKVLADSIRASIQAEITSKVQADASAATTIQLEIDRHVNAIKQANPDIARFERYLYAPVNARVEAAKAAGKIRSSEDFVREYKSAVDTEVQELRNLGLQYRADGKNEALARNQQVLAAFTPPPQQVGDHTTPAPNPLSQGESNDDYFNRRAQQGARLRNLT